MSRRTGSGLEPGRRLEDGRLVTGRGRFVADLIPPDALHAWFVRSPFAAGSIVGLDVSAALAMPGVVAAFTATNLELRDLPVPGSLSVGGMDLPMLARDRVTFVGQPVAVVLAETAPQAEDAAGMVIVEVEPTEPVLTAADAVKDRTLVHAEAGTNVVLHEHLATGPEPPDDLIDVTVQVAHPRLAPAPLETLAVLVSPDRDGVHIQVGVQSPHRLRDELAQVMAIDPSRIRVSVPDVGGAFGMKRFYPEYAVVAKAALLTGRAVAWVQPRREMFLAGSQGRGQHHEVTLRAGADGRIHEARFTLATETGAYPHLGILAGRNSRLVATGLYDIPRVDFELIAAVTNLPPTAPYRGAGRPEAALAIERAIDALAAELQIDFAEIRRRNFIAQLPHETPTGAKYDSGDYGLALERALALVGYDDVRREQAERRRTGANPIGVGIGAFVERAGGAANSWEFGAVEIAHDGTIVARTGSTSAGQSHETVWRRLVAEVFDVDSREIVLHAGDTAEVATSIGSFASRSTQIGASALWRCSRRVRAAAVELAAAMLEASPHDVVVEGGSFHVAGVPDLEVKLAEVAARAVAEGIELASEEKYSPGAQTFPYGVHAAVVEVEPETGRVTPLRLVAVDDVGNVLDAAAVAGQLHGSVAQGLGAALFEEMQYDEGGQPLTATFIDYLIPSAGVVPQVATDHLTHPAPSNPLGVKGAGEGGCIGMPPAILNATMDALAPWGVTELQVPLRPEKIWRALRDGAGND